MNLPENTNRKVKDWLLPRLIAWEGRLGMRRRVFSNLYRHNLWGNAESRSGHGSSLASTEAIRSALPGLLTRFGIRTMLDAACGDFHWMSQLDLDLDRYLGADIVPALIDDNRRAFARGAPRRREFAVLDITRDPIPPMDLILCRHCMIHMPHADITTALRNFVESGSRYLMATTIPGATANRDIRTGSFRELNLELPPFSLPAPLAKINDPVWCDGQFRDDGWLYLWSLEDLRGRA